MIEWKKVVGYDDYVVSNTGIVKSLKYGKERLLKFEINIDGYHIVRLSKNGKKKPFRVHRLVAELFIDNPSELPVVNHKDGDKTNNIVNNLEWSTVADNTRHAFETGLINVDVCREAKRDKMKPVLQLDKDTGEVIRRFESYREVLRELNINRGNLSSALNGKNKTCAGYVWKYENK